ncbi:hypothetical protein A3Q56_08436, partial [Intoshia linei]
PISHSNKFSKNLSKFYIFNKILYYISAKADLIVAPSKLQDKLIEIMHSGPQACHPGVRAVISVISRSFYFIGLGSSQSIYPVKRNYDKTVPNKPTYHFENYTPNWPYKSKLQQPFIFRDSNTEHAPNISDVSENTATCPNLSGNSNSNTNDSINNSSPMFTHDEFSHTPYPDDAQNQDTNETNSNHVNPASLANNDKTNSSLSPNSPVSTRKKFFPKKYDDFYTGSNYIVTPEPASTIPVAADQSSDSDLEDILSVKQRMTLWRLPTTSREKIKKEIDTVLSEYFDKRCAAVRLKLDDIFANYNDI